MNFGFRAEVGYNAAKDVTFLKTNTNDFDEQLTIPVARGSKEDAEIRTLLEDQNIVDFTELAKPVTLPSFSHGTFGLVGDEEDDALSPSYHDHVVLFGKAGSGAVNLIRFWLLFAARNNIHIVSVSNPGLYGMEKYIKSNLVHHLNDQFPLDQQFEDSDILSEYNREVLLLVGPGFVPSDEDTEFIRKIQTGEIGEDNVYSLIHHDLREPLGDDYFFGAEGGFNTVSYAVIGDVTPEAAELVGDDVPTRNPRGIAWFSEKGGESKRVRTFIIPRSFVHELRNVITFV